jgi:hypothetical protein
LRSRNFLYKKAYQSSSSFPAGYSVFFFNFQNLKTAKTAEVLKQSAKTAEIKKKNKKKICVKYYFYFTNIVSFLAATGVTLVAQPQFLESQKLKFPIFSCII